MWRKSSYSANYQTCIEVEWRTSAHSASGSGRCGEVGWRKSSHSQNTNNCVETAAHCDRIQVRDSKDKSGPQLSFTPGDWMAFIAATTRNEF